MFQVGDKLIYGIHGVCCVVNEEKRIVDRKSVTYLVLEPQGQTGSRYLVPTHNEAAMGKLKKILTAQELEDLLGSDSVREDAWIPDENLRKKSYRELISSSDREALARMTHTLYCHRKQREAMGKKCHMCDENFLRDVEKLLCSEVCAVLDMDESQARQYIRSRLSPES